MNWLRVSFISIGPLYYYGVFFFPELVESNVPTLSQVLKERVSTRMSGVLYRNMVTINTHKTQKYTAIRYGLMLTLWMDAQPNINKLETRRSILGVRETAKA